MTKYSDIFGKLRPVYDGRKNLYSRNFLPIPDRGVCFNKCLNVVELICQNEGYLPITKLVDWYT